MGSLPVSLGFRLAAHQSGRSPLTPPPAFLSAWPVRSFIRSRISETFGSGPHLALPLLRQAASPTSLKVGSALGSSYNLRHGGGDVSSNRAQSTRLGGSSSLGFPLRFTSVLTSTSAAAYLKSYTGVVLNSAPGSILFSAVASASSARRRLCGFCCKGTASFEGFTLNLMIYGFHSSSSINLGQPSGVIMKGIGQERRAHSPQSVVAGCSRSEMGLYCRHG